VLAAQLFFSCAACCTFCSSLRRDPASYQLRAIAYSHVIWANSNDGVRPGVVQRQAPLRDQATQGEHERAQCLFS